MVLSTALNFQGYKIVQVFSNRIISEFHYTHYLLQLKFIKMIQFLFLLHYIYQSKERQVGFVCQLVLTLQNT